MIVHWSNLVATAANLTFASQALVLYIIRATYKVSIQRDKLREKDCTEHPAYDLRC